MLSEQTDYIVAAPPDLITGNNVEDVSGFSRRVYHRELLPQFRAAGGKVAEIGKTRAVDRVAFVTWIKAQTRAAMAPKLAAAAPIDGVDALADELGLRRVANGGRR